MFDETMGLKKIGIPIDTPSIRLIVKMVIKGSIKDTWRTINDGQYSLKRKLYWLLLNPLYHVEKWRGVRLAAKTRVDDTNAVEKYSLESLQKR